ncbi:MAG: hypothetical protein KJ727_08635, partial [Acidobacteria bacterium]|nr:hypothetical protein [Acidobacteriota bacterium]
KPLIASLNHFPFYIQYLKRSKKVYLLTQYLNFATKEQSKSSLLPGQAPSQKTLEGRLLSKWKRPDYYGKQLFVFQHKSC